MVSEVANKSFDNKDGKNEELVKSNIGDELAKYTFRKNRAFIFG